ncbi:GDYXXLXY domain-containing protein [Shewanella sp. GXUN23E]|uniref:GDYXXLXY domain-containing protein n=1 Tax=Shewanella sp. GXUN23E TaxID=3422498 RepID=UPI003D7DE4C0
MDKSSRGAAMPLSRTSSFAGRWLKWGMVLTIILQLGVLAVEYISSVWPLWFGQPVMLTTAPVDPRSLFRGNYVRLNYDISTVPRAMAQEDFKVGQPVYLSLNIDGKQARPLRLSATPPATGTYLRGRVRGMGDPYRLEFGIEALFLPKDKAIKADTLLRDKSVSARILVLDNGRAALDTLYCGDKPCELE